MRINAFLNKIKMKMSFKSRIFVLCVVLLLILICLIEKKPLIMHIYIIKI